MRNEKNTSSRNYSNHLHLYDKSLLPYFLSFIVSFFFDVLIIFLLLISLLICLLLKIYVCHDLNFLFLFYSKNFTDLLSTKFLHLNDFNLNLLDLNNLNVNLLDLNNLNVNNLKTFTAILNICRIQKKRTKLRLQNWKRRTSRRARFCCARTWSSWAPVCTRPTRTTTSRRRPTWSASCTRGTCGSNPRCRRRNPSPLSKSHFVRQGQPKSYTFL